MRPVHLIFERVELPTDLLNRPPVSTSTASCMSKTMVSWPVSLALADRGSDPVSSPAGHTAPIEREIRQLSAALEAVKDEQEYIVVRERLHRDSAFSLSLPLSSALRVRHPDVLARMICSGRIDQRPRQVLVDPADHHARRCLRLADFLPQALLRGQACGLRRCPS